MYISIDVSIYMYQYNKYVYVPRSIFEHIFLFYVIYIYYNTAFNTQNLPTFRLIYHNLYR